MKKSSESNRILLTTLMIFFAGIIVYNIGMGPVNGAGLIYACMVCYWMSMLRKRPVEEAVRRRMYGIGLLMLMLLFLRGTRYFFTGVLSDEWARRLWYFYYLPFTLIPLLGMDAALLVWNGEDRRSSGRIAFLYICCAVLICLILSNDLHQLAFRFVKGGRQAEQGMRYNYGPVYYLAVCWITGCTALTLYHLFHENRAAGRNVIPQLLFPLLLISAVYFVSYYLGGLPTFRGRRFLQLPEAYCIFYICLMEACLEAGWFPMHILKQKEEEVRESTARVEEKNRLYESMAESVRPQLERISEILEKEGTEEEFRPEMAKACVLTAYIKRRCNLVLKAEEQEMLPMEELRLSVAESLEYLRLCGIVGAVFLEGEASLPGRSLVTAFDLYEEIAETAMEGAEALLVNIAGTKEGLMLRLTLEHPVKEPSGILMKKAAVSTEDGVWYAACSFGFGEGPDKGAVKIPGTQSTGPQITTDRRTGYLPSYSGNAHHDAVQEKNVPAGKNASGLTAEFSQLGSMITAYTIEKEKLHARLRLHDDLGKMLLLGRRYVQGKGSLESVLSVWQNNQTVLEDIGMADPSENSYAYMQEVAKDVGIRLAITGKLPEEPAAKEVVVSAIHECLTNTIRHAHGDELDILAENNRIVFTNNGEQPAGEIIESGGLGMLRAMAEAAGIRMKVEALPRFRLTLELP